MSKREKTALVPKLRFPEFRNSGEWALKPLGKLGELLSGLTYNPDDVREKGLLVLRSSNIKNNMIDLCDTVYVRSDIKGVNLSIPNDILICVRNGSKVLIGKNALIPEHMPVCTHGTFMMVFRAKNYKFVYQLFQTSLYEKQVNADLGATINSINGTHLKKYTFFVPKDLDEQQKIADCLSSLDDLISAENKKLSALKAHKKGLMQKLFPAEGEAVPEWRFPEFRDSGEWTKKEVHQLGELISGLTYAPNDVRKTGLLVLRSSNIKNSLIELKDNVYVRTDIKGANLSVENDILICVRNGSKALIGKNAIIPKGLPVCTHGAFMTVFRAISPCFAFQIFQSPQYEKQVKADLGATINSINGNQLKKYIFYVPKNPEEQQKIADCLSSLDALITAQIQKIETLKVHKKGLMQGLFPSIEAVEA